MSNQAPKDFNPLVQRVAALLRRHQETRKPQDDVPVLTEIVDPAAARPARAVDRAAVEALAEELENAVLLRLAPELDRVFEERLAGTLSSMLEQVLNGMRAELAASVHRMVREAIAVSIAQTLGEPPHEVAVPLGPERRRDEDAVAAGDEIELQARPDAKEHLELEALMRDAVPLCDPCRALDQALVMGGDADIRAASQHPLDELRVGAIDVRLRRERNRPRFEIRALDDPQVRLELEEGVEIGGGAGGRHAPAGGGVRRAPPGFAEAPACRPETTAGKHTAFLGLMTPAGRSAFERLVATADVLVDLAHTTLICSMGIRALVLNARHMQRRGARMALLVDDGTLVSTTLRAVGIETLLPVYTSVADA